jgi:glycosyltransferase involved in cell wall biosynthesis
MRAQVAESRPPGGTLGGVGARRLRICMFVYNNCASDARVLKEAATLAEAGHQVQIVAVLDKRTLPEEERGDTRIVRIDRNPLHYKLLRMTRRSKRRLRLLPVRIRRWRSRRRRQLGARLRAARTARAQRAVRGQRRSRAEARLARRGHSPTREWTSLRAVASQPPAQRRSSSTAPSGGASCESRLRCGACTTVAAQDPCRGIASRATARAPRRRASGARHGSASSRRSPSPTFPRPTRPRLPASYCVSRSRRRSPQSESRSLPPPISRRWSPKQRAAYRAVMTLHKPLLYLDYYWRAYRLVRNAGFDAFHAHDLNTLPIAALASRRHRARLVYDAHELYSEVSTLSALERRTWRIIERLLIGWADSVITVCESIANELSRRYQGGFAVHRGLPQLIEAAAYLERGVVVLMGWGTLEVELRTLIARLDLTKKVRIIGPASQPELLRVTAGADVGVIPYLPVGLNNYYTTPNKLFEYIAAGVPVVGSRLPELRRFVEGYGLGLTYHPDEPQDLARALRYVLDQPAILAEMRANAAVAHGRLNWDEQKATLLSLYGGD